MRIGALRVEMLLDGGNSLKDKRRVVSRLMAQVRKKFNAAVAEVDDMDKWRKAVIGVAVVSNDHKHLSSCLDHIMDFIASGSPHARVLDYSTEII